MKLCKDYKDVIDNNEKSEKHLSSLKKLMPFLDVGQRM